MYMPWPSSSSPSVGPSNSRHTYQKPLPRFSPPQQQFQRGHRSTLSYPGSAPAIPPRPLLNQSAMSSVRVVPVHGGGVPQHLLDSQRSSGTTYGRPVPPPKPVVTTHPPPGAQVYPAGDPRLGGRLCWNCSGRGRMSFFGIDLDDCPTCNGIGRTY